MACRKISLAPGEYFHIYNRGNSKQKIFLCEKDKDRFTKLLFILNSDSNCWFNFRDDIVKKNLDVWDCNRGRPLVSIGAWVLMPNHFHLYLKTPMSSPKPGLGPTEQHKRNRGNITLFMHKLSVSYAKYFNTKYNRVGCLFEGPFKSVHIENDAQAKYLFSYIHLNPVKLINPKWKEEGIKNSKLALEFLKDYKWSSYHDYMGKKRSENKIISSEDFPKYFSDVKDFNKEILSWINFG